MSVDTLGLASGFLTSVIDPLLAVLDVLACPIFLGVASSCTSLTAPFADRFFPATALCGDNEGFEGWLLLSVTVS